MMLIDFKDINLHRVKVYRNLHKKCFSIVSTKTHKVIKHMSTVVLADARFRVSKAGRARVLREKRKNVHAYVYGTLLEKDYNFPDSKPREAYYNPYAVETFVDKKTKKPVDKAVLILLTENKIFYWRKR